MEERHKARSTFWSQSPDTFGMALRVLIKKWNMFPKVSAGWTRGKRSMRGVCLELHRATTEGHPPPLFNADRIGFVPRFVNLSKRIAKERGTLERIEMNRRLSREGGKVLTWERHEKRFVRVNDTLTIGTALQSKSNYLATRWWTTQRMLKRWPVRKGRRYRRELSFWVNKIRFRTTKSAMSSARRMFVSTRGERREGRCWLGSWIEGTLFGRWRKQTTRYRQSSIDVL